MADSHDQDLLGGTQTVLSCELFRPGRAGCPWLMSLQTSTCLGALAVGMRRFIAVLSLGLITAAASPCADLFVAPYGSDAWSGRLDAQNDDKSDDPLATVKQAQEAVRKVRHHEPKRTGAIVVMLRGGTYFLDKCLVFSAKDSGTPEEVLVVYKAYPDELPVLSGGKPITGWKTGDAGSKITFLPEVKSGEWDFRQLFVNGDRRSRPRLPREGYYHVARTKETPPAQRQAGRGPDRLGFDKEDIRPDWHDLSNLEVVAFHPWLVSSLRIHDVDPKRKTVVFSGTTSSDQPWSGFPVGTRYLVEDVREALAPGEFYLDRGSGTLT